MKFKVGDLVLAKFDFIKWNLPRLGTIIDFNGNLPYPYTVKHEGSGVARNEYRESELTLVINPNDIMKQLL